MVAVIAGNGLGLLGTSLQQLGLSLGDNRVWARAGLPNTSTLRRAIIAGIAGVSRQPVGGTTGQSGDVGAGGSLILAIIYVTYPKVGNPQNASRTREKHKGQKYSNFNNLCYRFGLDKNTACVLVIPVWTNYLDIRPR